MFVHRHQPHQQPRSVNMSCLSPPTRATFPIQVKWRILFLLKLQEAVHYLLTGQSGLHMGTELWNTRPANRNMHWLASTVSPDIHLSFTYLSRWFHPLEDAKVNENPSQNKEQKKFYSDGSNFIYATGLLQHLVSKTNKDNTNFYALMLSFWLLDVNSKFKNLDKCF